MKSILLLIKTPRLSFNISLQIITDINRLDNPEVNKIPSYPDSI